MKKLLPLVAMSIFLLTGCSAPFILMKSVPFTAENANVYEQNFETGSRIYYAIVVPEKFRDDTLRVQVLKQDDKVPFLGYSMERAETVVVDRSKNYYTDYFVINADGYYIMQVFYIGNTVSPIARYDFRVK